MLLSVLVCFGSYTGSAASEVSNITIKGRVVDANGDPVPGAGVKVKGTDTGTITDIEGYYKLDAVVAGSEIEIVSLGYTPVTVVADAGMPGDIVLQDDRELLDEVLVIGYGTQRKQEVTGSVVSVKEGQFNEGVTSNAFQMLIGKAAGVNVAQ